MTAILAIASRRSAPTLTASGLRHALGRIGFDVHAEGSIDPADVLCALEDVSGDALLDALEAAAFDAQERGRRLTWCETKRSQASVTAEDLKALATACGFDTDTRPGVLAGDLFDRLPADTDEALRAHVLAAAARNHVLRWR
jgi:hypothetical protein